MNDEARYDIYIEQFRPSTEGEKQMLIYRVGVKQSDVPATVSDALEGFGKVEIVRNKVAL